MGECCLNFPCPDRPCQFEHFLILMMNQNHHKKTHKTHANQLISGMFRSFTVKKPNNQGYLMMMYIGLTVDEPTCC